MSEEIKNLTKTEAIKLVGGQRDDIHCFLNPGGMLVGADWSWKEFEKTLDKAEKIHEAGEQAKAMKHPLAVFHDGRWAFFESIGTPDETANGDNK